MNSQDEINTIVAGYNKYLKAGGYIIAVLNLFKSIYEIYGCFELLEVINGPCEKFQKFLTEEDPEFDFPDENCELFAKVFNLLIGIAVIFSIASTVASILCIIGTKTGNPVLLRPLMIIMAIYSIFLILGIFRMQFEVVKSTIEVLIYGLCVAVLYQIRQLFKATKDRDTSIQLQQSDTDANVSDV